MFANPTQSSLTTTPASDHTLEGLLEEFRRCKSEFKNGDETVQHKIALSVLTTISSGVIQTVRYRHQPLTLLGLLSSLFFIILSSLLSCPLSNCFAFFRFVLICVWSLLCGGSLSCQELEGVLSSGIVERLCTRIESGSEDESESGSANVVATLVVFDRLCCGLRSHITTEEHSKSTDQKNEGSKKDSFSLTRRCGFALARIEKAVLMLEKRVGGKMDCDEKIRNIQQQVGGMIVRHFRSSIQLLSKNEIGAIGIDLTAVRREMEAEREKEKETARKAEEERQREFSRKMREMEEMKRMNEKWIKEGRQREEEKKREEERKRNEEEERRRNVKEGVAAIEVFLRDKFTLSGNVFTKCVDECSSFFSISFGPVVVRITFVIRHWANYTFDVGLIAADMVEQITSSLADFSNLKRAANWQLHPQNRWARQNGKRVHEGSACKAVAVGQRVVMEADGREGKRTLKLSQDGETQPVFFSNIPVPFRFGIQIYGTGSSVEIVSSEVLGEASMVGGSFPVVMN
ncbi:hypothetical protein BLNAU_12136 [Blattamonas nauphoetae]|uniref:Uncharacterized protein n=1 Tax=Blattamonas nauphoetae TaxID=2049346 RepID=A0ABQ9XRP8_9EUKA|nr:hypothetical protein BLNAU_12136 [Blattamonas nauphoetae]